MVLTLATSEWYFTISALLSARHQSGMAWHTGTSWPTSNHTSCWEIPYAGHSACNMAKNAVNEDEAMRLEGRHFFFPTLSLTTIYQLENYFSWQQNTQPLLKHIRDVLELMAFVDSSRFLTSTDATFYCTLLIHLQSCYTNTNVTYLLDMELKLLSD